MAVNYHSNAEAAEAVVSAIKQAGGVAVAIQGDIGVREDVERLFKESLSASAPWTSWSTTRG
ncbi:hypothetical protein [Actinacidiphila soli]|uniref:hypothetical protein n=1 Tax=Actinacidiphila soli TaxID=2487275 RepID=UPI0019CF619E|nr:hypothetical protein [Actinacidiphila soli]